MAKKPLTQIAIDRAKPGTVHTDAKATGLILEVSGRLKKTWYMRLSIRGKQTKYKLGTYPGLSLADARKAALEHHTTAIDGGDPRLLLDTKSKRRGDAASVESWTLEQLTEAYIEKKARTWKQGSGRGGDIRSRMAHHVYPHIDPDTLALNIKLSQVLAVLEPLAANRPAQFDKVQKIMRAILNHQSIADPDLKGATLQIESGFFTDYFADYVADHVEQGNAAVPVEFMPDWYAFFADKIDSTSGRKSVIYEALLFTALTGARTDEVIGHKARGWNPAKDPNPPKGVRHKDPLRWREIDLDAGLWFLGGDRHKNNRDHIKPLPKAAVLLLRKVALKTGQSGPDDFVFPGTQASGRMSNDALGNAIRRGPKYKMVIQAHGKAGQVVERCPTVHGLRSTLTDFGMLAGYSDTVCSMALGHMPKQAKNDTSFKNYFRSQLVEERRELIEDWAQYCVNGLAPSGWKDERETQKNVTKLRKAR